MLPTAISKFESDFVTQLSKKFSRRLSSLELALQLREIIERPASNLSDLRQRMIFQRIAIRARPDNAVVDDRLLEYAATARYWGECIMPDLFQVVAQFNDLGLPVPLIFSCRKFLTTATSLQMKLKERFFGIAPIIVCGDAELSEERYVDSVLTLPVDDSYEGLPAKVFEAIVFFNTAGSKHGILKIDDDAELSSLEPFELECTKNLFLDTDYAGSAIGDLEETETFHEIDRSWHFGKCQSNVPLLYGKPFRRAFAAGGLYYLSTWSMRKLTERYCRFPGHLEGELYEDKAVGDALLDMGIPFTNRPLGQALNLSFTWQERSLLFTGEQEEDSADEVVPVTIFDTGKRHLGNLIKRGWRWNFRTHLQKAENPVDQPLQVLTQSKEVPAVLPVNATDWCADDLEHQKAFNPPWDDHTAEQARALLARVMRIANAIEIPLFLYWGTLLGHVREGKILAWDDDLDLALFDPTKIAALRAALIDDGLHIHDHDNGYVWIKVVDPAYPVTSDYEWTYPFLDIYFYNCRADRYDGNLPNAIASANFILPGRQVQFEGISCWEPEAPLEILDRHYPGWRTEELSPAWDHRREQAHAVVYKRQIDVDDRGRKKNDRPIDPHHPEGN